MAETNTEAAFEASFEKSLDVAEKHLKNAMTEGAMLGPYIAVAMIEAAVNRAVMDISPDDVVGMLRELAEQVETDANEED